MPYTGTTPYTAQEFVPGQKALAQDVTNMSYVLAKLDQNASGAYCVKEKQNGADNQTMGPSTTTVNCKTVLADPLGSMNMSDSAILIPFDGLWLISGYVYINTSGATNIGGLFFRPNGNAGSDVVWGSTSSAKPNVSGALVFPLNAGDYIELCYYPNGATVTCAKAIFSVSLLH